MRQILLHIVPGTGAYGNPMLGMHLYSWAFVIFALMIVGGAILLFNDRQFGRPEPWSQRLGILPLTALAVFAVVTVGNVVSTLLICGLGFCPDNPTQYLLFSNPPA
jgi:hypothetical protein